MHKRHIVFQFLLPFMVSIFGMVLLFQDAHAQVLQPCSWEYEASRQQVGKGDTLSLIFTVEIAEGWYLYSNDFDPELGPMLTAFEFDQAGAVNGYNGYELMGDMQAVGAKKKYDPIWEGEISYFENSAVFRQSIIVTNDALLVRGSFSFQVCSSADGKCIQGKGDFTFDDIKVMTAEDNAKPEIKKKRKNKDFKEKNPQAGLTNRFAGRYSLDWVDGDEQAEEVNISDSDGKENVVAKDDDVSSEEAGAKPLKSMAPNELASNKSLLHFAFLAFLAGFAALATPCVFPMVPMTVTYFTHQKNERREEGSAIAKAVSYGLSIILIYTIAGTLVAWVNGPAFANWLSTHWLPNVFFFAVFVCFALSFLGMFEITLPSGLVTAIDKKSDKGGWFGIFFMAFTLVLVSFSCTGPIVGALLVASAGGEVLKPVIGMASFALALALPFSFFAAFPNYLKNLPKSGSWLNSVKVVLGFLELALGLKFLSVADQVYHWGILDREVYLAIWIVIFMAIGFYLLGKIKLPHDSVKAGEKVGVPQLLLALCSFAFVIYLIPGMFGAPLKALAGYLPPMSSHDFNLYDPEKSSTSITASAGICETPTHADKLHLPHGIEGYFDLEEARFCAMRQGKPLFIDFTGHGCVNCREMEARVWSDPKVLQMLKQDFVVVALYIDEKKELPEEDWYTSTFDGKVKKTMGAQNADFQITKFNNNAQPFYVILDPYTMELVVEPKGYDLEVNRFLLFLEEGRGLR